MNPTLLQFEAAVSMSTEASGRFRAVAYSGGVIPDYGFHGDVAINLDSIQLSNPTPVLIDHDNSIRSTAGHATLSVENNQLIAVGKLNSVTDAGEMVEALMRDGHPIQLSIGINAEARKVGKPITINGREMTVATVFENASVRELSFVPVGADPRTSAHLFKHQEPTTMPDNQELDTLRAALAEEKARNEALTGELNQLRERFAAVVRAERERSMAEFAIDTETKEAMLGMTDEHFAVALKLAKSAKTSLPSHLFHDTVNNGAPPGSKDERAGPGPLTAAVKAKFSA